MDYIHLQRSQEASAAGAIYNCVVINYPSIPSAFLESVFVSFDTCQRVIALLT